MLARSADRLDAMPALPPTALRRASCAWIHGLALLLAACAPLPRAPTAPVEVKILAINDFHGNLRPPQGGIRVRDPQDAAKTVTVSAGGAEHLATAVRLLAAQNPNHVFVAAGDLVGATPLLSALFHDEPTIEAMNLLGLDYASVGNHEFDEGAEELLRIQNGGCHPTDGCADGTPYEGADFRYLSANAFRTETGEPLLAPYAIPTRARCEPWFARLRDE